MNKNERKVLRFFMRWMDDHVDERGVRQPPGTFLMRAIGLNIKSLYNEGYLTYRERKTYPTAKAEVWWMEEKRRMRGERSIRS